MPSASVDTATKSVAVRQLNASLRKSLYRRKDRGDGLVTKSGVSLATEKKSVGPAGLPLSTLHWRFYDGVPQRDLLLRWPAR